MTFLERYRCDQAALVHMLETCLTSGIVGVGPRDLRGLHERPE